MKKKIKQTCAVISRVMLNEVALPKWNLVCFDQTPSAFPLVILRPDKFSVCQSNLLLSPVTKNSFTVCFFFLTSYVSENNDFGLNILLLGKIALTSLEVS
jgi:hypothetical protein